MCRFPLRCTRLGRWPCRDRSRLLWACCAQRVKYRPGCVAYLEHGMGPQRCGPQRQQRRQQRLARHTGTDQVHDDGEDPRAGQPLPHRLGEAEHLFGRQIRADRGPHDAVAAILYGKRRPAAPGRPAVIAEHASQKRQRSRLQSRDLHLRDTELLTNLQLGHVAKEAADEHPPFVVGQALKCVMQRHLVGDKLEISVQVAEVLLSLRCIRLGTEPLLQGGGRVPLAGDDSFTHLRAGHLQGVGQLPVRRMPAELLCQALGASICGDPEVTQAPGHVNVPALVTKVALQFTHHRRHEVAEERDTAVRAVCVDRLDQTDRRHLLKIGQGLAPVLVPAGQPSSDRQVQHHEPSPQAIAHRTARQRLQPDEQFLHLAGGLGRRPIVQTAAAPSTRF